MQVNRFPSLEEAKRWKISQINAHVEALRAQVEGDMSALEAVLMHRLWLEAKDFRGGPGAATPMLDAVATSAGVTRAQAASFAITQADDMALRAAATIGKAFRLRQQVRTAASVREVADINW